MGKYRNNPTVVIRENRDIPTEPSIAVYAGAGQFGVGHARIFIAAKGTDGSMKCYTTDLQGDTDKPAKIYFEETRGWANPEQSRTWVITQVRAENAIAVAKQLARQQSTWSGYGMSGKKWAEEKENAELFEKHVPTKYGKKGTLFGKMYKSQSRYATCASYAQRIMLAAGIPAPKYLFLQTGSNLVSYDKTLLTAALSLLRDKPKIRK